MNGPTTYLIIILLYHSIVGDEISPLYLSYSISYNSTINNIIGLHMLSCMATVWANLYSGCSLTKPLIAQPYHALAVCDPHSEYSLTYSIYVYSENK